jgi:hypothetical protein
MTLQTKAPANLALSTLGTYTLCVNAAFAPIASKEALIYSEPVKY